VLVSCSGAVAPANGTVSSATATVTYGCSAGYTLNGNATQHLSAGRYLQWQRAHLRSGELWNPADSGELQRATVSWSLSGVGAFREGG